MATMKVRVRPLRGAEFVIDDVSSSDTKVSEIKERIQKAKGDEFVADSLRLIHLGKILDNDKTLSEYGFQEDHFLVCMIAKKKEPKKTEAAPAPVAAPVPKATSPPTPTQAPRPAVPAPAATNSARPAVPAAGGPLVTDESVNALTAMGFVESDVRAALAAAFGNVDRAAEFLTSPELMQAAIARQERSAAAATARPRPAPTATAGSSSAPSATGTTFTGNNAALLQQFRNSPGFGMIQQMVQNNPSGMNGMIQQLQTLNPALFQAVTQDADTLNQFVEMLAEDPGDVGGATGNANPFGAGAGMGGMEDMAGMFTPEVMNTMMQQLSTLTPDQRAALFQRMGLDEDGIEAMNEMIAAGGVPGVGAGGRDPPGTVRLTPEEVAAIDRLSELGFSRNACLEAYLACDKDEQLAANYLFTNPPEEDNDMNDGPPPPPSNSNVGGNDAGDI